MVLEQYDKRTRLSHIIAEQHTDILNSLELYVIRAGITGNRSPREVATELLNDVASEALLHSDRWNPDCQPMAWILGIAANLIKRRKAEYVRRVTREPLVRDLSSNWHSQADDEIFDALSTQNGQGLEDRVESQELLDELLSPLSESDREIVSLAILNGQGYKQICQQLGISPGVARVRLKRALDRLRDFHKGRAYHD